MHPFTLALKQGCLSRSPSPEPFTTLCPPVCVAGSYALASRVTKTTREEVSWEDVAEPGVTSVAAVAWGPE